MQKIIIEVNDNYATNVIEMLHSLKGIMIDKIKFDNADQDSNVELDFMKLQTDSMKNAWDNQEDEVWNDL